MQLSKYLLILSSLLVISGCAVTTPKPVIKTEYVKQTIPLQIKPKPVSLGTVTWTVVTKDNIQEFLAQQTEPVVFYAISPKEYEILALNLADITRYIKQQKAIILYYEKAIKDDKPKTNDG